jgi:glutaminyl-tRNA synthetase
VALVRSCCCCCEVGLGRTQLTVGVLVGIEFTPEGIAAAVTEYMEANKEMILEQRYKAMTPVLVNLKTQTALKWAPPADVKKEMDIQLVNLLGPKDERDAPPKKQPKAAPEAKGKKPEVKKDEEISKDRMFEEGFLAALHKPGGNEQIIPANMEAHLKATGGKVFTRFPPEVCLPKLQSLQNYHSPNSSSPTVIYTLATPKPLP